MTARKPPELHRPHYRKQRVPEHAHPLVRYLFRLMNQHLMTMKELAERSGVQRTTIRQWKTRANPLLTHIEACLNVFDVNIIGVEVDEDQVKSWRQGRGRFVFRSEVHGDGHQDAQQDNGAAHA
jgi:transcriptional regulator with XRE-family HTH domain